MLVISIILKAQSKYILVSPERQYRKEKHQADKIFTGTVLQRQYLYAL